MPSSRGTGWRVSFRCSMPSESDVCPKCHLPRSSIELDEARFGAHEVLWRCKECGHIMIYRSGGKEPTTREIIDRLKKAP
jgi:RNase P subunit RPR2